jgi:hypothetical protein
MSNVIAFPPCRPPFLEIVAEAVDGYSYAIIWRDARYRPMVVWRGYSRAETIDRVNGYIPSFGGLSVVDRAAGAA